MKIQYFIIYFKLSVNSKYNYSSKLPKYLIFIQKYTYNIVIYIKYKIIFIFFQGWNVYISTYGHVFRFWNIVALGMLFPDNSDFVVFWSRSISRMRQPDAWFSTKYFLVHMLGLSLTFCNDSKRLNY